MKNWSTSSTDELEKEKIADELSALMENSEFEKDLSTNTGREVMTGIEKLESKMKKMEDQLYEAKKIREQLSHVTSELKTTRAIVLSVETKLEAAIDAKLEALKQTELKETELQIEKEKNKSLLMRVSEINETIMHSRVAAIEAEKEKFVVLSEKEAKIELEKAIALEAEEKLEYMRKELQVLEDLENQIMVKSKAIESLKVELNQANELQQLSEKAAPDAINEINQLKSDLEMQERKNMDQSDYVELLENEVNKCAKELKTAKKELHCLDSYYETTKIELKNAKIEMKEITERETEARVEISTLKSELEKAKKENQSLEEESKNSAIVNPQHDNSCKHTNNGCVMMSKEEYVALIGKAAKGEKVVQNSESGCELGILKKELETMSVKVGVLRTRAAQAASRAEVAEKGKAELEDQMRKWKEQREKRKAALAALKEESISKESSTSSGFEYEQEVPKTYVPLAKVLNLKF
ncbi:protein WEAK CHLOROPLAST MOVEMENT UNDER BLUE LIGHT-like 3 [Camellia sinensis]|uniref:protein WEAK CHLOROPLAST MOVEMENT UNDER BLUE LIGHT-like 3 n=1 Tax=Camellia sinensis TaxID=4442 RepID=UPI0010355B4F|nr:protein WEAK CHLOROPLAST MOVEMENT UNDER BLUE LIGHT-like 3 [Camellia sinensis]